MGAVERHGGTLELMMSLEQWKLTRQKEMRGWGKWEKENRKRGEEATERGEQS